MALIIARQAASQSRQALTQFFKIGKLGKSHSAPQALQASAQAAQA